MCIRYAARVLWPIFTFSLSVFAFFMCHFARLGTPVYEDAEDDGKWGRNWTGLIDQRAFIRSWNVVLMSCGGGGDHRPAHSVKGVGGWIKITGSIIGVYFSIVCDLRPWRAPQNQSHFAHFALFFCVWFTQLVFFLPDYFCTGNKHVEQIFDIFVGQNWAFLHRGLRFSGYLVCLQMLHFCILQKVSKHCVAMLILLNIHWQAALMVFFLCVCLAIPCVYGHWLYLMTSNWLLQCKFGSSFFQSYFSFQSVQ